MSNFIIIYCNGAKPVHSCELCCFLCLHLQVHSLIIHGHTQLEILLQGIIHSYFTHRECFRCAAPLPMQMGMESEKGGRKRNNAFYQHLRQCKKQPLWGRDQFNRVCELMEVIDLGVAGWVRSCFQGELHYKHYNHCRHPLSWSPAQSSCVYNRCLWMHSALERKGGRAFSGKMPLSWKEDYILNSNTRC